MLCARSPAGRRDLRRRPTEPTGSSQVPNIGGPEVIIILVVVIILFGAKKLPELGSSVGKSITNFKSGLREAQDEDDETTSSSASANGANPDKTKTDAS